MRTPDKEVFGQQKGVTPKGCYTFLLPLETVFTVSLLAHVKDKLESLDLFIDILLYIYRTIL